MIRLLLPVEHLSLEKLQQLCSQQGSYYQSAFDALNRRLAERATVKVVGQPDKALVSKGTPVFK